MSETVQKWAWLVMSAASGLFFVVFLIGGDEDRWRLHALGMVAAGAMARTYHLEERLDAAGALNEERQQKP